MSDRRQFLLQSTLALTGLSITGSLTANPFNRRKPDAKSIYLNANENPYGPSPMAREAILQQYLNSNRYPDDPINALKVKIAHHWGVKDVNILLGAGSSEIIGLAGLMVSKTRKKVLTAEPAYKVWNNQATAFGLSIDRLPLTTDRKFDLKALAAAVDAETAMVYICNPNNPTGTFVDVPALKAFANEASKKTMVFVDEAYTEYAELESLASLAITNKNIIVAKTYSKIYGLAGARIGYAIAHPDTITALGNLQAWPDFAVSTVAAAAASASLDDTSFVNDCRKKTAAARELCYENFKKHSLEYIPASANFILFNIDSYKKDFIKEMAAKDIHVQFRQHFGGKWCRVTMGTIEEMERFCEAL